MLVGTKLFRIKKNGCNDRRALPPRPFDQRQMSRVKRAHSRNQSDDAALRTRLPRRFFHPRNGPDYFHEVKKTGTTRPPPSRVRDRNASGPSQTAARPIAARAWSPGLDDSCRGSRDVSSIAKADCCKFQT